MRLGKIYCSSQVKNSFDHFSKIPSTFTLGAGTRSLAGDSRGVWVCLLPSPSCFAKVGAYGNGGAHYQTALSCHSNQSSSWFTCLDRRINQASEVLEREKQVEKGAEAAQVRHSTAAPSPAPSLLCWHHQWLLSQRIPAPHMQHSCRGRALCGASKIHVPAKDPR